MPNTAARGPGSKSRKGRKTGLGGVGGVSRGGGGRERERTNNNKDNLNLLAPPFFCSFFFPALTPPQQLRFFLYRLFLMILDPCAASRLFVFCSLFQNDKKMSFSELHVFCLFSFFFFPFLFITPPSSACSQAHPKSPRRHCRRRHRRRRQEAQNLRAARPPSPFCRRPPLPRRSGKKSLLPLRRRLLRRLRPRRRSRPSSGRTRGPSTCQPGASPPPWRRARLFFCYLLNVLYG